MGKQGGKRNGAGRKPRSEPREPFTVRLEPEAAAKFKALCEAREQSQSEQFAEMVKRARLSQNEKLNHEADLSE